MFYVNREIRKKKIVPVDLIETLETKSNYNRRKRKFTRGRWCLCQVEIRKSVNRGTICYDSSIKSDRRSFCVSYLDR